MNPKMKSARPLPLTPFQWKSYAALALLLPFPAHAQSETIPEEIVLGDDPVIEVTIGGILVRLEVETDEFGPPVLNPEIAAQIQMEPRGNRGWQIGPVVVEGKEGDAPLDFGFGEQVMRFAWADRAVSDVADGTIGVHHLPYNRVVFELASPAANERVLRYPLKKRGGRSNGRLGTEMKVGKKRMSFIFSIQRASNLITAPTANFIATHHEGGFVPDSDSAVDMRFNVMRPTRTMRIAYPIELGELSIAEFAVRVADYGKPTRVGEIKSDDPRFSENTILVSRRKGRGKPDRLTRLGRDQIAHCSRLTYDLAGMEAHLSCGVRSSSEQ
jgi:hypothetical protein